MAQIVKKHEINSNEMSNNEFNYDEELLNGDDLELDGYDLDEDKEQALLEDDTDEDDYKTVDESKSVDDGKSSTSERYLTSPTKETEEDVLDLGIEAEDFQDIESEDRGSIREDKFSVERNNAPAQTARNDSKRMMQNRRRFIYNANAARSPDTTWKKPTVRTNFRANRPPQNNDRRNKAVLINPNYEGSNTNNRRGWDNDNNRDFSNPITPWIPRMTPMTSNQPVTQCSTPFFEPPPGLREHNIDYPTPPPQFRQNQWQGHSNNMNLRQEQVPQPFYPVNQLPPPPPYLSQQGPPSLPPPPQLRPTLSNLNAMSLPNQNYNQAQQTQNSNYYDTNNMYNNPSQNYQPNHNFNNNAPVRSQPQYRFNHTVDGNRRPLNNVKVNNNGSYNNPRNRGSSSANFVQKPQSNNRPVEIRTVPLMENTVEPPKPEVQPTEVKKQEVEATKEDEEMRQYKMKIEEQKRKREQILRMKEERRKAALEKLKKEEEPPPAAPVVQKPIVPVQQVQQVQYQAPQMPQEFPNMTFRVPNHNNAGKRQLPHQSSALKRVKIHDVLPTCIPSEFMANRLVSVKNNRATVLVEPKNGPPPASVSASSSFFTERKILTTDASLLNTKLVVLSNLSTATNEDRLIRMTRGVGIVEKLQMDKQARQATILFKNVASAHAFFKKYQRYMLDLSMIEVKLRPML